MKEMSAKIKTMVVEISSIALIILLVYAAVSKIMDFENFKVQLGQSPLLNAYAGVLVWMVPMSEIIIALLLAIIPTRKMGLFASMGLMVMFTVYIYLILNYSSYVPCSCGGILEKLDWNEHLYFNLAFAFLALIALVLSYPNKKWVAIRSTLVIASSILVMVLLFFSSEIIIHKHNNFIRKYTPITATLETTRDLEFNGYYFAGKKENTIYFGNHTAPALITEWDVKNDTIKTQHIKVKDTLYQFNKVQLRVQPPYFYILDGTVPCVFKGKLEDPKAVLLSDQAHGFTKAEVIDSTTLVIRSINDSRENILATFSMKEGKVIKFAPKVLEKQIDGLFDTDGTLQYSEQQQKFVYLYYYRNQYIVTDKHLSEIQRGNTIDTTSKAKIKIEYLKERKETKFSAPPLLVNRLSCLHNNLLFVNSTLPGKYDVKKMWDKASVIDVYDILTKTYVISFYINAIEGEKINDLLATDTHIYALIGTKVVAYRLGEEVKNHYKN